MDILVKNWIYTGLLYVIHLLNKVFCNVCQLSFKWHNSMFEWQRSPQYISPSSFNLGTKDTQNNFLIGGRKSLNTVACTYATLLPATLRTFYRVRPVQSLSYSSLNKLNLLRARWPMYRIVYWASVSLTPRVIMTLSLSYYTTLSFWQT